MVKEKTCQIRMKTINSVIDAVHSVRNFSEIYSLKYDDTMILIKLERITMKALTK